MEKGMSCCISRAFVSMIDIGSHGQDHVGKSHSIQKIQDDFMTFDLSIVVFISEQQFNVNKDLVDIWMHKVVQLVKHTFKSK